MAPPKFQLAFQLKTLFMGSDGTTGKKMCVLRNGMPAAETPKRTANSDLNPLVFPKHSQVCAGGVK